MSQALPALVVGCGGIGSRYDEGRVGGPPVTHAGAYAAHAATRLAGGVDPDPAAREAFERRWDAPCFGDLGEALESMRPALVSLCGPAEARPAGALAALEAGVRAVWAEKPLAAGVDGGRELVAACARAGVPLQVNFVRRFDRLHREVAEVLAGERGPAVHVGIRYSGTLAGYGSHAFDLFRWFAGEPEWVQAVEQQGREPAVLLGAGDSTGALLHVPSENADIFDTDIYARGTRFTFAVLGEELAVAEQRASPLFPGYVSLEHPSVRETGGLQDAMVVALDELVRSVQDGGELSCSGADGLAALRLEAAVRDSLASEARVTLE